MEAKNNVNLKQLWGISAVILAIMLAISAWAWTQVPAGTQVPIHWNAAGQPIIAARQTIAIFSKG